MIYSVFFFFQAEDGIRDLTVTGVQTCALPISDVGPRLLNRTLSSAAPLLKHPAQRLVRSEEHTSELQSQSNLVCRLLLEKKKYKQNWASGWIGVRRTYLTRASTRLP